MIVVVGSRHDEVSRNLVDRWSAALCSAEDLITQGWVWHVGQGARRWIVDNESVADDSITCVFVRRSAVYADELVGIHPDDRTYLAAETQAFLGFILATTRARVCQT